MAEVEGHDSEVQRDPTAIAKLPAASERRSQTSTRFASGNKRIPTTSE